MIVVDVETTGLNPYSCSIVSIGALDFANPKNTFYIENKIFEGAEITERALEINGFTREQIQDSRKPSLEYAINRFFNWAKKCDEITIAGENVAHLDVLILEESAKRYNLKWPFGYRSVDLHTLSRDSHIRNNIPLPIKDSISILSLDETLRYVGLPKEPEPHNAIRGAVFEAEAFSRLIYGRSLLPEFESFSIPEYLRK